MGKGTDEGVGIHVYRIQRLERDLDTVVCCTGDDVFGLTLGRLIASGMVIRSREICTMGTYRVTVLGLRTAVFYTDASD